MFEDFQELLSAFNAQRVKYLIVGGYAVSFHAQPRVTKDLDLFIKADPENALAAYRALAAFGAPLEGVSVSDLANPRKFVRFGHPPIAVDVMPGVDGVDFDSAWERRVEGIVDQASGLVAFFISKDDLIAAKRASGRLRDLADVEEIQEAQSSRENLSDDVSHGEKMDQDSPSERR
jgi:hypothetical protein